MEFDGNGANNRVYHRTGSQSAPETKQKVCFHWRAGKCVRLQCPFLHRELPVPKFSGSGKRGCPVDSEFSEPAATRRNQTFRFANQIGGKKTERLCSYWVRGNCSYGEKCKFLHCWSSGESFSLVTHLEGHTKVVTGVALPSGSDMLYTGSNDETVRVWNCQTGQCMAVVNLGGEVGCMISEDSWVFVGIPNTVKAWDTKTNSDLSLSGPVGQVYALVAGNGLLFAGIQDATILAWKFNAGAHNFEPTALLSGHHVAVISLAVGANRLFSGAMDHSIRVWSLETLQCMQTLTGHTSVVMSLLCWDKFLLSCSPDQTVKVWAATETGNFEVTYTHDEEHGLLALCGMLDSEGKPILFCACNDSTARIYDLPSFSERGKIFAKQEIRVIQAGRDGLFFTGDGTGLVRVWKCVPHPSAISVAT